MSKYGLSVLAAMLLYVPAAMAIDRDARMIDTGAIEFMELDDADGFAVSVSGETAFSTEPQDWAVVIKAAYGELSPIDTGRESFLSAGLGLKYYLAPETSVALMGDYSAFDESREAKMGSLVGKHRLAPVSEAISPYVTASIGIRDRSSFSSPLQSDASFSETVFTIGGGVEFRMTDVLSFVVDAKIVEAEESDDGTENWSGVHGFVGLQYYFMQLDTWNNK